MKKLFLVLFVVSIFSGCDVATNPDTNDATTTINYFVKIDSDRTSGTTNTVFTFTADSNDIVTDWIVDGVYNPIPDYKGSTTSPNITLTFSSGNHTIGAITQNGTTDEKTVSVSKAETVFNISATMGSSATTELYLNYPTLTIDGIDYDIESSDVLSITKTDEYNIVNLHISVDNEDSFVFVNNNAENVYGIDLSCITMDQMDELFQLWYPERYTPPEPSYSQVLYTVSATQGGVSDLLYPFVSYISIGGTNVYYSDMDVTYSNDSKIYQIHITIDFSDMFLFVNNNFETFFRYPLTGMTFDQLKEFCDILNRYPEKTLAQLQEVYP